LKALNLPDEDAMNAITPAQEAEAETVKALYQDLLSAWNERTAAGYAALFEEDGMVVGFDGSVMNGRSGIENELNRIFADHITSTFIWKIRGVRFMTPDTAILKAVAGMRQRGQEDINPAASSIQTLVAVLGAHGWRIALFQNTPAQFHGRPDLSESLTEELRLLL
jgi:uncharacterized protein (TIGR02246 family)